MEDSDIVTFGDLKEHCAERCELFEKYIKEMTKFKITEAAAQVAFLTQVTELTKEFTRNTSEILELKRGIIELTDYLKRHVFKGKYPPEITGL